MRSSVHLSMLLAVILMVSLLPVAGATESPEPPAPPSAGPVVSESWTPGELDVDWASFAAEHRDEYQSSSWAAVGETEEAVALEARNALADSYAEATGADGGLEQTDATFNDLSDPAVIGPGSPVLRRVRRRHQPAGRRRPGHTRRSVPRRRQQHRWRQLQPRSRGAPTSHRPTQRLHGADHR